MKMKSLIQRALWPFALSMLAVFMVVLSGCETTASHSTKDAGMSAPGTNDVVLKEGDVLKVVFPESGAQFNTTATIRPDGKITVPVIGEVTASGKTPSQLQQELVEKFSKEINSSKDISVVVVSSSFSVYVMGAVMHAGKVTSDHTLTALEAIMEAGGYDPERAQLKSVKVVRTQAGKTHTYLVNLKGVQTPGSPVDNFHLQPSDIVIVPQKFTWL